MGRNVKDEMKQDKRTKIWSYPVYNPTKKRSFWKSSFTADRVEATRLWEASKKNSPVLHGSSYSMLLRAARHLWAAQHDPHASPDGVFNFANRWDEMEAALGDLDLSDPQFAKKVHQWRNGVRKGMPGLRVMRNGKEPGPIGTSSTNLYIGDIIMYVNFVSRPENEGDEPMFKGTPPRLFKLKRDLRKEPLRASTDLFLTDEQVADLKRVAQQEREASDDPKRYSVDERILMMGLHGGGQRVHRIKDLVWNAKVIDLKNRVIDFTAIPGVVNSPNKPGHDSVPMDDELFAFLKKCWGERVGDYYLDRKWTRSYVKHRVARLFRLIDLRDKNGKLAGGPHVFRKTVATKAGDDAHTAIGTSKANAQERYVKRSQARIAQAFSKVTYDAPVDPKKVFDLPKRGRPGKAS